MAPLAASTQTTTTFNDGNTTFTHKFNNAGDAFAGNLSFPYGAEVIDTTFRLKGEPSQTTWTNFTTDSHYGGTGSGSWSGTPPSPFTSGVRSNIEAGNGDAYLMSNPSVKSYEFDNTNQVSNIGNSHQNSTGEFIALADQGYNGVTKKFADLSVSSSASWSYMWLVVPVSEYETHVMYSSSSSTSNIPSILRINATTGAYLGTASLNYGSCSSSVTRYFYDSDVDSNGNIWTVHMNYYTLAKWTLNSAKTQWTCSSSWNYNYPYYLTGVDFDDSNGKLYLTYYDGSNYPTYTRYLLEVNPQSPTTSINGSWQLGTSADFSHKTTSNVGNYLSGLIVNFPRVIVNEYNQQQSRHHHYTFDSNGVWLSKMGIQEMPDGGHYGLSDTEDGEITFACHHSSYCTSVKRKIHFYGNGALTDQRAPSITSDTVIGTTSLISKSVSTLTLSSAVGYLPSGTSIEIDISNDGGTTWKKARLGSKVTFPNAGSQITWRAHLNGTSTASPILDHVGVEYVVNYQTSGYFYVYQYIGSGGTSAVAATINWSATMDPGTTLTVYYAAAGSSSSCSPGGTGVETFTAPGQTKTLSYTSGYYTCLRVEYRTSNSQYTPTLHDLSLQVHSNAPSNVYIDVGGDGKNEFTTQGTLLGSTLVNSALVDKGFNDLIPDTGSGTVDIDLRIGSAEAGIVTIESFSVEYKVNTVNFDIDIPSEEILHNRDAPYEVVTTHIIGEDAIAITSADLSFIATPLGNSPAFTWLNGDSWEENDPEDWVELDESSSWSTVNNSILEIHWFFHVNADFPGQDEVRFRTTCTDDTGSDGFSPIPLLSEDSMRVNQSYGLGWLKIRDNDGEVTSEDIPDGAWVAAGETIHFQGAMWFAETEDPPKDSAFDIRVSQNGFIHSNWRDTSNPSGSFFISIDTPTIDIPEGLTYEVQTYNERDTTHVLNINDDWRRTYRIDATAPEQISNSPLDGDYESASSKEMIRLKVEDAVGSPTQLELFYWVEADHDTNRNGEADPEEYTSKTITNSTDSETKWFFGEIDHSRNPNMGRVSYYWDGGDEAGNPLHYTYLDGEGETHLLESGPGFDSDVATFKTRKDSKAIFTGLEWIDHSDDEAVYAGTEQIITLGLLDANTAIDFEHVSLIFDFEGPDPTKDRQVIAYSGMNDTFWSESAFISISPNSQMREEVNASGMPWILIDYHFTIDWTWPDEELSDLSLTWKERGSMYPETILRLDQTFYVENDLVLSKDDYQIEDISEPRTGVVADGTKVRKDDRLLFSGRVVYEGSKTPAPTNVGIRVDVFDGENIWSDGSLGDDGSYALEIALGSAKSLQSSPTRTCLISINGIPGKGQDMTGDSVSTTIQVEVDDTAPRVTRRVAPLNVIDVSADSDLSNIPVEFLGTEDDDLTGSEQYVHWVMKDNSKTLTLGAGKSLLGMQQDGQSVIWTGGVDLTDNGRLTPRAGDWVGFYLTGWDGAGNEFPLSSNSEASPIPELASEDTDFERQWVRLGATGPQLKIDSISLDDDHVSPGTQVEITAIINNAGGETNSQFKVGFYEEGSDKPFATNTIRGIAEGESIPVSATWDAKEKVTRLVVIVDNEDVITEINDNDNRAEHRVDVVYASYFGWVDSPREQPLIWAFAIISIITLLLVGTVASRTSLAKDHSSLLEDEEWEEEDWDEDEEYEDDDEYEDDEY